MEAESAGGAGDKHRGGDCDNPPFANRALALQRGAPLRPLPGAVGADIGALPWQRRRRHVVLEYRSLQLLQLVTRLQAELVHQETTPLLVGAERVRLPPGPVEREHELRARALSIGLLGDERLELGHEGRVPTEGEVGVNALLERLEPQLFEPRDRLGCERLGRKVSERRVAPKLERLA